MLTIYRRHVKSCAHRTEGRKYRRCRCPIWVDGYLGGAEVRESLALKDWEKAQQKIREWEAERIPTATTDEVTVAQACAAFKSDAVARGLQESTLRKYRVLFNQMESFANSRGLEFIKQLDDVPTMRQFRESWIDNGVAALKKLERLRAFLRFAQESGWIKTNPAKHLRNPKMAQQPTMPFTQDEMIAILSACPRFSDRHAATTVSFTRIRPLVLMLRYSGMRIGDTATCPTGRLSGDRLFLYTQKRGVPVNVKLPPLAVEALKAMPPVNPEYFFWTGEGKKETASGNWRRSLRRLFALAGIKGGHPHRFRDTFAVELLLAGVPLERVSILLGHSSIRVTERHYSPWIRARQEQLEADLERSWATDPLVLAQTKGTPQVHGKKEVVN